MAPADGRKAAVGLDGPGRAAHRPDTRGGAFAALPSTRGPRVPWPSVAAVAVGGFFGGLLRYVAGEAWPTPAGGFPWSTFAVNTTGAFVLALLLVLVLEVLPPTRYLRPAIGTGFCGALTTFSSVVTAVDQLAAHGRAGTAAAYVAASLAAGLGAAALGLVLGRMAAVARDKGRG